MLDLFIGKRELGKTTLAVKVSKSWSTRVNFDPRHMIETTRVVLHDDLSVFPELLDECPEITIQPVGDINAVFADTCSRLVRWLGENPGELLFFLVDEIRFLDSPQDDDNFRYLVRAFPREQVSIGITCHGVTDVSTDLRRIADYWILFRLTLEADLERIRERCGEQVEMEVKKLKPFEYIVWNDAISSWKKHDQPAKWFIQLKASAV
jgi:hypothetical protein